MIQSKKLKNKVIESTHQPPHENLLLLDLPDEIWKPYPIAPFDEYYEVSNKGRIKRLAHTITKSNGIEVLLSERIIKSTVNKQRNKYLNETIYCLSVKISLNKLKKVVPPARLVYHAFIEPFDLDDRALCVRHKDGNRLNCLPANLYLFERKKMVRWLMEHGRRKLQNGIGDRSLFSEEEIQGWNKAVKKTVTQYDIEGRMVQVFESRADAARSVGVKPNVISAVLKGRTPTAGGFFWREGSENPLSIDVPAVRGPIRVAKYTLKGDLECVFSTIKEAGRKLNFSEYVITERIRGRASQKNFILTIVEYLKEPPIHIEVESFFQPKVYDLEKYGIPEGKSYPFQNLSSEDLPGEEWKEICGANRAYKVSNYGRFKTVDQLIKGKKKSYFRRGEILEQIIKQRKKTNRSMLMVVLNIKGKAKGYQVSNLVCRLFCGEITPQKAIVYKDNDSFNCKAENLTLESLSKILKQYHHENYRISNHTGRRIPIAQYTPEGKLVATYASLKEAGEKSGIPCRKISLCALGKKDLCGGFKWKHI